MHYRTLTKTQKVLSVYLLYIIFTAKQCNFLSAPPFHPKKSFKNRIMQHCVECCDMLKYAFKLPLWLRCVFLFFYIYISWIFNVAGKMA